jgi:anti-anti-sigma factor
MAGLRPGTLAIERLDEVFVVRPLGEHDLASASDFGQTLDALINEGLGIVVDVSAVEFVDLAVVRALLDADRALRERRRRLALQFGTACPVRRLLRLLSLEERFICTQDRAAAVEMARASFADEEPLT